MAKKSRPRRKKPEGAIAEAVVESFLEDVNQLPAEITGTDDPPAPAPMEPALHTRLELMKQGVAKSRSEVADTIAQLEEWRAEIDGTIAYLRGSK